jgi:predicted RNase H-like nuclease
MHYIGLDGCKHGWFFVQLDVGENFTFGVIETIGGLSAVATPSDIVLLDIPIGLRTSGPDERLCDREARQHLKPKRSSSVFPSPCRPALSAATYHEASAINYENTGRKLSQQTWAIAKKIEQVDNFLTGPGSGISVREMHPEICFWALNNCRPMAHNKKTVGGFDERINLLSTYFDQSEAIVGSALKMYRRNQVARDDIVDALVGAVSARYSLATIPAVPELDDLGLRMEMVYPRV